MTERSESSMLPIVGNLTSELLDEFDPEFVKWMMESVAQAKNAESEMADKDWKTVKAAIGGSEHFRKTMSAALASMEQTSKALGKGTGEISLVVLLLVCGWKLCERAMTKVAEGTAT